MLCKNFVVYAFICVMCMSCNDILDDAVLTELSDETEVSTKAVQDFVIPKGAWEDWHRVKLANYSDSVYVPWNRSFTATSIPDDVRFDIRAEDGWKLVGNTLTRNEPKMNYLIFYNQFTGVLKGFYYLEEGVSGNNAFWQLEFTNRDKVLYNQDGFYTYPLSSDKTTSMVHVMNVTTNKTKGFTIGWNCFQVELAYQYVNNPNVTIGISAYQQNVGNISLQGEFTSSSSGSIISSMPSSSSVQPTYGLFNKSNITMVQDSAKQWILSNISIDGSKRPIKNVATNVIKNLINNDISSLVTSGLGLIFGSWGASRMATPTNYSLNFKTTGDIKLDGSTGMLSTTAVPSVRLNVAFPYGLGFWNLANAPVLSICRYAEVENVRWNPSFGYPQFQLVVKKVLDPERSPVVIHGGYSSHLKSLSVTYSWSTGHFEGEKMNYYSETANAARDAYKKSSCRLYPYRRRMGVKPNVVYQNDENGTTISATSWSTNPLVVFESNPVVNVIPQYRSNATGGPYHDITTQGTAVEIEDIKVKIEYTLRVNGKDKHFYSVRTYDPTVEYITDKLPIEPKIGYWTAQRMIDFFNL